MLLRFFIQLLFLYRKFTPLTACTDPELNNVFERAKGHVPNSGNSILVESDINGPIAINWPRKMVVIPASLDRSIGPNSLRRIFTHELAHIARHDQFVLFAQRVIACFLWLFLPIHFLNRAICRTREDLCDNYVGPDESIEYCKDLLRLLTVVETRNRSNFALEPSLFSKRDLESRVRNILSTNRCHDYRVTFTRFAITAFVALACAITFASVGPVSNEQHKYITELPERKNGEDDERFQPLFRSIALTKTAPENVSIEINAEDKHFQFAQLRYGSVSSDRVTVLVINDPKTDDYQLYVDRNRDRTIAANEIIRPTVDDQNARYCQLDSWIQESDKCEKSKQLPRQVVFRRNLLADRISFATLGLSLIHI